MFQTVVVLKTNTIPNRAEKKHLRQKDNLLDGKERLYIKTISRQLKASSTTYYIKEEDIISN